MQTVASLYCNEAVRRVKVDESARHKWIKAIVSWSILIAKKEKNFYKTETIQANQTLPILKWTSPKTSLEKLVLI